MDEIQVELGRVIKEVHADFGGNLTGFVVICMKREPESPQFEMKAWFGGIDEIKTSLATEVAKTLLDKIISDNQCSTLEGAKILLGRVLERKFLRDRQYRESQGKR